ncbi:MAG: twin-arginine translocase TatA/TatE family subunit [Phascolarctobacterium sp.]|nr:twin-arginine translocase TatA/TatE family subunit [Candidatus Phascolarctobacterium caballi]MCQ2381203.1 twin-arginine translocase TatA/TatE family subunit [Acidaminococcaceae bacterium]
MRLGATELLLILAIAFIVFGAGKLTGLGKALGTSIREFKQEMKNPDKDDKKEITDGADKPADK